MEEGEALLEGLASLGGDLIFLNCAAEGDVAGVCAFHIWGEEGSDSRAGSVSADYEVGLYCSSAAFFVFIFYYHLVALLSGYVGRKN
jgi:hypothetical protein